MDEKKRLPIYDELWNEVTHANIYPNGKVEKLKEFLNKYFPDYIHKFFLSDNTEADIFTNTLTFEHIFDNMGYIVLYPKRKIGKIRIAQQAKGRSYPVVEGFENIPAWSRGKGEWKELSPFYISFSNGTKFENWYQSFKVWEKVDKQNKKDWKWPAETHVDKDGNPNSNWYAWHEALVNHDLPVRRPNGKAIPLYSFWEGKKLGIVEARKQIYISYLKQLYRAHPVYQKLLAKVREGKNVMIIEPDGPYLDAYPEGLEVDLSTLYNLIEVTNYAKEGYPEKYRPYGHGNVISMCLLEDSLY